MKFVTLWSAARKTAGLAAITSLSTAMLIAIGCRAQKPWPLWSAYASRFLDGQGRVIDHSAADNSTSEGESYAMFFALVSNDQQRFDKLLNWTEQNMAGGDLTTHLPAWSWGKAPDGSWHALDSNSATDADLWMAYTLCEAGRLWRNERYRNLGLVMMHMVAQQDVVLVPPSSTVMIPGEQGFHPSPSSWYVNPSYTPPFILDYFAHLDPHGPWGSLLASLPAVVQTSGGFAMDWMSASAEGGVKPSAAPGDLATLSAGHTAPMPVGGFDAIRVYLWAGMADPKTPHVRELLAGIQGMASYLNGHPAPPVKVGPEGQIVQPDAPAGFSAAVIPYLDAMGQIQTRDVQASRLEAMLDGQSGLYGRDGLYYDQNLALFEQGWTTGRFHFERDGSLRVKWK